LQFSVEQSVFELLIVGVVRILCKVTAMPSKCFVNNGLKRLKMGQKMPSLKHSIPVQFGVVHILRNALGGGGQRFVTKPFENMGICTVFRYEGGGGVKNLEKLRYVLYGRPLWFIDCSPKSRKVQVNGPYRGFSL
jgi:hypothetical protein